MKTKLLFAILVVLVCISCEPKERLNINNPVCCVLDSISIHYYLTTEKNELTTTFRQGETMIVHYDMTNHRKWNKEDDYNVRLLVDTCNPYLNALHGKCYTTDGRYIESMSFSPSPLRPDEDWSDNNEVPKSTITLGYLHCRSYAQAMEITIPYGEYYFETFPKISTLTPVSPKYNWDTTTYVSQEPLRVYFIVAKEL